MGLDSFLVVGFNCGFRSSLQLLSFHNRFVALEDFENGIKCYQSALRIDARHYNSWYGLGIIYLRQEKFEFAEHHFQKAFQINPHSSVILCYLGIALHTLKVWPFYNVAFVFDVPTITSHLHCIFPMLVVYLDCAIQTQGQKILILLSCCNPQAFGSCMQARTLFDGSCVFSSGRGMRRHWT